MKNKKCSWQDIIDSDADSIHLIWFWSIINKNTHKWNIKSMYPVLVHGFKRIYNLEFLPESVPESEYGLVLEYCRKYWIKTHADIEKVKSDNVAVLNTIYTWDKKDFFNGILVQIDREDFEHYAKREWDYDLFRTEFELLDPLTGKLRKIHDDNQWYVLVAPDEKLVKEWVPFQPYHDNTRAWAYEYWEKFWEMFEKTTFDVDGNLVT